MVDFAGWEMPLLYRSIQDEHEQTRRSGSLFDVSHMGRLRFTGPDSQKFLNRVVTRKIDDMVSGQSRYGLVCNPSGGTMDDVIVSRFDSEWGMVCNASNREKLLRHFHGVQSDDKLDVEIIDQTEATAMVAIQGPRVIEKLADVLPIDLRGLKRYHFASDEYMMVPFTIYRSGYTGEDGVEIVIPARQAELLIKLTGREDRPDSTIRPAGLGARDTLRLEAGMHLYGHELEETIDPISAGLSWAVDLSKDFIGAVALRKVKESGPERKLVGLELHGRRIARQGSPVVAESGAAVGTVTSGTLSPTLGKSIALALVQPEFTSEGTGLAIDLRGDLNPARVTKIPFYKRG